MYKGLEVKIGKLRLLNPVMVASGTFGYAEEFSDFMDLKKLGAVVTKTITLKPRPGNKPPRTCETPSGMLNSIGLENPGLNRFVSEKLPYLKKIGVPIIVSIASEGDSREFVELAKCLDEIKEISAIELNISCPNIRGQKSEGRSQNVRLVSQDPKATYAVVRSVRKVTKKTLITKLSPNVTSIEDIALAAERAGTDALALINTLLGMSIDTQTLRPRIAAVTAGLSGPAIRPVAVRMTWEVYRKTKLPIIGMGGITDTKSALEFILAGATAVAVGTANFVKPSVTIEIIDGLKEYLNKNRIADIKSLIGALKL